jgi:hypothetical protein
LAIHDSKKLPIDIFFENTSQRARHGSRDRKDCSLRPAWAKCSSDPISNTSHAWWSTFVTPAMWEE